MAPPSVTGFTHVSLSVRDLDASLLFYRDVLGLPVLAEPYDGEVFDGLVAGPHRELAPDPGQEGSVTSRTTVASSQRGTR